MPFPHPYTPLLFSGLRPASEPGLRRRTESARTLNSHFQLPWALGISSEIQTLLPQFLAPF